MTLGTLRRVEKGWDASGRLGPLWKSIGGRDKLAEATGIRGSTLSGYNTGRLPLGKDNAARIAEALGVTTADLGEPSEPPEIDAPTVRRLLREVAEVKAQIDRILDLLEEDDPPREGTGQ